MGISDRVDNSKYLLLAIKSGVRLGFDQMRFSYPIKLKPGRIMVKKDSFVLSFSYYDLVPTLTVLKNIFINGRFSQCRVKDKDVLDIGESIGAQAIYFTMRGARHVYAYEPSPPTYAVAKLNVARNNMDEQISLYREACGGENDVISIAESTKTYFEPTEIEGGVKTNVLTLDDIVIRHGLKDAIAVIDCEGAEYDIIKTASKATLRKFEEFAIDYHYGSAPLVEKLESSGFRVKASKPIVGVKLKDRKERRIAGTITAYRL